jgi:hypothetical protein
LRAASVGRGEATNGFRPIADPAVAVVTYGLKFPTSRPPTEGIMSPKMMFRDISRPRQNSYAAVSPTTSGQLTTPPTFHVGGVGGLANSRVSDNKRPKSRDTQPCRLAHLVISSISNISAAPSSRSRSWLGARRRSIVPATSLPFSCNSCLSWFHFLPILPSFGFRSFTTPSPLTTHPP